MIEGMYGYMTRNNKGQNAVGKAVFNYFDSLNIFVFHGIVRGFCSKRIITPNTKTIKHTTSGTLSSMMCTFQSVDSFDNILNQM